MRVIVIIGGSIPILRNSIKFCQHFFLLVFFTQIEKITTAFFFVLIWTFYDKDIGNLQDEHAPFTLKC